MLAKAGGPLGVGVGCPVSCLRRLRMSYAITQDIDVDAETMNLLFTPPDGTWLGPAKIHLHVEVGEGTRFPAGHATLLVKAAQPCDGDPAAARWYTVEPLPDV